MKYASIKSHALRTAKAIASVKGHVGGGCQSYGVGVQLGLHSAAPPPVEEYEAWLASLVVPKTTHRSIDGRKLRRIVVMKRNGCSIDEIAYSIGLSRQPVSAWLKRLPAELAA